MATMRIDGVPHGLELSSAVTDDRQHMRVQLRKQSRDIRSGSLQC